MFSILHASCQNVFICGSLFSYPEAIRNECFITVLHIPSTKTRPSTEPGEGTQQLIVTVTLSSHLRQYRRTWTRDEACPTSTAPIGVEVGVEWRVGLWHFNQESWCLRPHSDTSEERRFCPRFNWSFLTCMTGLTPELDWMRVRSVWHRRRTAPTRCECGTVPQ